jgi:hypothetical protein
MTLYLGQMTAYFRNPATKTSKHLEIFSALAHQIRYIALWSLGNAFEKDR